MTEHPDSPQADEPRNIVICLDGTSNEPESGTTNVARLYDVAVKDAGQIAYYDPGVGTMGARSAVTPAGKKLTRTAGLVIGYGVRDNLEEAYTFLMQQYRRGDRIFVFGFSRGAYTARALTGMLRTVGLLRPGAENLVPYAVKLYTRGGKRYVGGEPGAERREPTPAEVEEKREYWRTRRHFAKQFGNPDFPDGFDSHQWQVHFLGVWDTVKAVGWLNWRARWEQARWPFTRRITNVELARHALAIDERRRPFAEYRFAEDVTRDSGGRHVEMWFAGVHSDVGGQFPEDHLLSDIAFAWMVQGAMVAGLRVDSAAYRRLVKAEPGAELPTGRALGAIHSNGAGWWLAGGWRHRPVQPGDPVHPSVRERVAALAGTAKPYSPTLPPQPEDDEVGQGTGRSDPPGVATNA
jgi:uncharacterized protein (DUF2235 family)